MKGHVGALGLDVAGAFIPGVTGLGMVARVGGKVDDVVDASKVISRTDAEWKAAAETISKDHSYSKHVLGNNNPYGKEYGSLFQNQEQHVEYLTDVMKNSPDRFITGGRNLYWDDRLGTMIIEKSNKPTSFVSQTGKSYFLQEVQKLQRQVNRLNRLKK